VFLDLVYVGGVAFSVDTVIPARDSLCQGFLHKGVFVENSWLRALQSTFGFILFLLRSL